MASFKEALQYAQKNPDSDFANKFRQGIQSGQFTDIARNEGIDVSKMVTSNQSQPKPQSALAEAGAALQSFGQRAPAATMEIGQDIKQTGQGIVSGIKDRAKNIAENRQGRIAGQQGFAETTGQDIGQVAGGIADVFGQLIKGATKTLLSPEDEQKLKIQLQSGYKNAHDSFMESTNILGEKNKDTIAKLEAQAQKDPSIKRDFAAAGGIFNLLGFLKGGSASTKVVSEAIDTSASTIKSGVDTVAPTVGDVVTTGKEAIGGVADSIVSKSKSLVDKVPDIGQKTIDFLADAPDPKTKTILSNASPEDLDKFVSIAEKSAISGEAKTGYEVVGDTMADATRKLNEQRKVIGQQKSEIIHSLNKGLDSFDSSKLVENLNSLKNATARGKDKSLLDEIISQAKEVKTKGSADKFIDQVQDMLYSGNKDLTIPTGSKLDKQLRAIIGEYNGALQDSLPAEYRALNQEYSSLTKNINSINRALGEVVEGTPIRGGSLIKQYFSPSGSKAKELFAFIKEKTGIDLAKDATLAKYTMELFGDPKARSLLEGVPTSPRGLVEKGVDILVQKTGVGESVKGAIRKAKIRKARGLTKTPTSQ